MPRLTVSRRRFLQASSACALAATAKAPLLLGSTNKSGSKPPVLGVEGYRYEVQHDCLRVPDHIHWQETHGVAVDSGGHVYIKHRTMTPEPQDAVVVFDPQGKFVRSFGKQFHGGGHGIDVRREGNEEFLYLCDNKGHIAKTTLRGDVVWSQTAPDIAPYEKAKPFELKSPGKYGKGKLFSPTNIAFAPDGGFWVGDGYGSHYVIKYDRHGKVESYFGGAGDAKGKLRTPHGLWWDDRPGRTPSLVVADRANARLQTFTAKGEHVGFVSNVLFPADIDIRGDVMLVPDLHARVTLLDGKNQVITHLGEDAPWREQVLANNFAIRKDKRRFLPGRFVHPHDACFDHAGNIYVAEWVTMGRVSRLMHVG